jgi:hypothetical protein
MDVQTGNQNYKVKKGNWTATTIQRVKQNKYANKKSIKNCEHLKS